tara:strand:+ start:284 stop:559 length:276 start_codon:yes stop_codon:yes gene_type:complete
MVLVVAVTQVMVVVDSGVLVVQDSLEMDPLCLELHHLNDQDLTPMVQGVVLVHRVGVVQLGAVLEAAAVLVLLVVLAAVTLAAAVEIGHLN